MPDVAGPDVEVVTPRRWPDLAELFERPGPRGGRQDTANCWCVVWRSSSGSPDENREQLCGLVQDGHEPGLLAYLDGAPVGWVSVAPRAQFAGLLRSSRFRPHDDDPDAFVISCFHVDRRARGRGVAGALLRAAVEHARQRGASVIDAYPSEPPDYKGRLQWYLDAGFTPLREAGKRTVVRLEVAATTAER